MIGQVPLRKMGQQNMMMTSFIAPQIGPSMAPGFLFAAQDQAPPPPAPAAPAQTPPPVQQTPVLPMTPGVPVVTPEVTTTPVIPLVSLGKQIVGPVVVIALVVGLVAWRA